MKTGMWAPLTGFVAKLPVNTPVLSRLVSWRDTDDLACAARWYAATASAGVAAPPVQAGRVPSGQAPVVSCATSGCSGARTMNVAPKSVSGRVVNTVSGPAGEPNSTRAPCERPIQLRCMLLIASVQSSVSRSSISRSAYAVIRISHWRMLRLNTGKLPRSERPSAVTSSLATTVPRPGHQFTGASAT